MLGLDYWNGSPIGMTFDITIKHDKATSCALMFSHNTMHYVKTKRMYILIAREVH